MLTKLLRKEEGYHYVRGDVPRQQGKVCLWDQGWTGKGKVILYVEDLSSTQRRAPLHWQGKDNTLLARDGHLSITQDEHILGTQDRHFPGAQD
jgi:hypothetical protein